MGLSLRNFALRLCFISKSVIYQINILMYGFIFNHRAYKNITRSFTKIASPPLIIEFFIYILLRIIHYVKHWLRHKSFLI